MLSTASLTAQAAPLNLTFYNPLIVSNFLDIDYVASTDTFTAYGYTTSVDGVSTGGGSFTLDAIIDDFGILNSGSVTVTNGASETLISGLLTDFGFDLGSEVFEFTFAPDDGTLLDDFLLYPKGGVAIFNTGFNDTFSADFSDSTGFNGKSDVAPVPVPAALWLFGTGLLGLVGLARRRQA